MPRQQSRVRPIKIRHLQVESRDRKPGKKRRKRFDFSRLGQHAPVAIRFPNRSIGAVLNQKSALPLRARINLYPQKCSILIAAGPKPPVMKFLRSPARQPIEVKFQVIGARRTGLAELLDHRPPLGLVRDADLEQIRRRQRSWWSRRHRRDQRRCEKEDAFGGGKGHSLRPPESGFPRRRRRDRRSGCVGGRGRGQRRQRGDGIDRGQGSRGHAVLALVNSAEKKGASQNEENNRSIDGGFAQNIAGVGAKGRFRHAPAHRRTHAAVRFGLLHQNDQDQEQGNQDQDEGADAEKYVHETLEIIRVRRECQRTTVAGEESVRPGMLPTLTWLATLSATIEGGTSAARRSALARRPALPPELRQADRFGGQIGNWPTQACPGEAGFFGAWPVFIRSDADYDAAVLPLSRRRRLEE